MVGKNGLPPYIPYFWILIVYVSHSRSYVIPAELLLSVKTLETQPAIETCDSVEGPNLKCLSCCPIIPS